MWHAAQNEAMNTETFEAFQAHWLAHGFDEALERDWAPGTVLEALDGQTDESYYVIGGVSRQIGQNASLSTNAYVNWFDSAAGGGDVTAIGGSAAYNQSLTRRLTARAALAIDYFDSEFTAEDFAFATALVGLRYDF